MKGTNAMNSSKMKSWIISECRKARKSGWSHIAICNSFEIPGEGGNMSNLPDVTIVKSSAVWYCGKVPSDVPSRSTHYGLISEVLQWAKSL
jgi:hypothetical protein